MVFSSKYISLDSDSLRGQTMRYYKQIDENGQLILIGTGLGGEEITEDEYNDLLTEIRSKKYEVDK